MKGEPNVEPANYDESAPAPDLEAAEEMLKFGITQVPVVYFHYKEFRYTNLKDAIAQAKRQQTSDL